MASITVYPAAFDETNSSYSAIASSYPASNVVGKSATNPSGYGVGVGLRTGSGAATSAYFSFDVSEIPLDATITGVSCKVSIYGTASFSTRTSTRQIRLCKSTTGVGTATSYTPSSSAGTYTPEITSANGGSWTRDELDNLRVLVYTTRSSSNTTSTTYVYVRGIDLTIEYEEAGVKYTLTIESNGYDVTPSSGEYTEGTEVLITVNESTMPTATLDGTDITSQFTEQFVDTSYSGAPSASSYTNLSSGSSYVAYAVGRTAENPYSSTSNYYATSSAGLDNAYAQYTFDLSSIPSNATNIVVNCVVAGHAESSTYTHSSSSGRYSIWALCSDGTAKTDQVYTTSTSNTTITLPESSWTYDELQNLQLRHYVGYYGGGTVGATLTITYTVSGGGVIYTYTLTISGDHTLVFSATASNELYVKYNGTWKKVTKIYTKENGSWRETLDPTTFFSGLSSGDKSGYYI